MSSTGVTAPRPARLLEHRGHQLARTFEGSNVTPIGMRSTGRMLQQPSRANPTGNTAFRLGLWRVDPALNEVSRDGTTVKLEPRTMRVLVCLAAHAGDVVSVNQLLDTVWKDLVVTQYSVYQAVAALRRALGDDHRAPTYIASVPRRGYRLVAPIQADPRAQEPQPLPAESPAETELLEEQTPAKAEPQPVPTAKSDAGEAAKRGIGLRSGLILIALLVLAGGLWLFFSHPGRERPRATPAAHAPSTSGPITTTSAVLVPPPHSVAVLPFTNLSGDPKQEYFSDGMTEEMISALSQIKALKVTARTSSFSFKGKDADIGTIGRKLNVAAILEGSVRRSGNKLRITAQLVDGANGFHLWSRDYDRDLNDLQEVLALQTEIANAVASALKVILVGDVAAKIELGGTHDPAAFDAYLRGSQAYRRYHEEKDLDAAIRSYTEAIRLDPSYAKAFAARALALNELAAWWITTGQAAVNKVFGKVQADAHKAIELAPELGEGHLALADALAAALDFKRANEEYERALALAPGSAQVLLDYGLFTALMGRTDAGIAAARRAVWLDPLNRNSHDLLARVFDAAGQYQEEIATFRDARALDPDSAPLDEWSPYYMLGNYQGAREICERKPERWDSLMCLAISYEKLGRHADAQAELAKFKAINPKKDDWYQYAEIYAQWGDIGKALNCLDAALRVRHVALDYLKTDALFDPLRKEPRFQAILRELKFPV
jgi:serine/threonine-protein kinase